MKLEKLYKRLTSYHAGISTFGKSTKYEQVTIPNKIFEYAICGLPSIVDNRFKAVKDYILAEEMGIVISDWTQFNPDSVSKLQHSLISRRYEFCIESEIGNLVSFYKELLS